MTRRCSHCSHDGHNSRTCPNRGVKVFGVRLTDGSIRKSASMGNLNHYSASGSGSRAHLNNPASPGGGDATPDHTAAADGYASEDFVAGTSSSCRERKKGVPWTEEEHRMFLLGLQKLGKGDWRGISRNYVMSRTPTQVASHAQKYFIRQALVSRRKRRSSLFDIVADEACEVTMELHDFFLANPSMVDAQSSDQLPAPFPPSPLEEHCESMDSTNSNEGDETAPPIPKPEISQPCYSVIYPAAAYVSPFFPFSFPLLAGHIGESIKTEASHEVVKPIALHTKCPINVVELMGMSKLSLRDQSTGNIAVPSLSLKLQEGSGRQSAFHAGKTSASGSSTAKANPVHAT